jgi:hypothetical protein
MLFRKKPKAKTTAAERLDAFRFGLNDLLDTAEKGRVDLGALITVLSQTSEALKYRLCVSAASSFHTSRTIERIG